MGIHKEQQESKEVIVRNSRITWIRGTSVYHWPKVEQVLQGLGCLCITFDGRADALRGIEKLRECDLILLGYPRDFGDFGEKKQLGDQEFLKQLREKRNKYSANSYLSRFLLFRSKARIYGSA